MTDAVEKSRPAAKPWIAAIHSYVPGRSTAADGRPLVKLSANENPLGCSPAAVEALAHTPSPALYPDPDSNALREAIAEAHGLDAAAIICGTGSGELLNIAAQAFAGPGDEVLFVRYGFSLYEIVARKCGATPVEAVDADYGTDAEALIAAITDRTRVIFLANPNNPTGSYLTANELARIHAAVPAHVLLVIDQAYAEYVAPENDDAAFALTRSADNVLVCRTFSKVYGLAGQRVGWAVGAPEVIEIMNRLRGPFNISHAGQASALAAVKDQAFVAASREHNRVERARFVDAIDAMGNHGLRALPSEANFVLVLFNGPLTAAAAQAGLMDRGYAVRHLPGQGLPHGLRITIGSREQMNDIGEALREMADSL